MSSEVGSGHVSIVPTFKGFRRIVSKEVDGATQDGTRRVTRGFRDAGTQSGRGFKHTFSRSSAGTSSSVIKSLNADIATTSKALSVARLKEQDAAGKVRVAEVQLTEARRKYGAESSQVVRVEERLTVATRGLATAQTASRGITDRLKGAQTQLAAATAATTQQTTSSAGGFRRFFAGVGTGAAGAATGLRGAFGSAFNVVQNTASRVFSTVTSLATGAAFAIGAVLSAALVGGFKRLSAIENAQAKLKGLGNSAEDVTQIMEDALGAVRGTAFGLDEAAGVAATAVAAGIKPGQELNKYLSLTADTATIAGTSIGEMGSILNKTTTSGKVYTESLNQLADRGIPVFQYLQDEYGVTAEKLTEMVASGKVDAQTLRKVLEENLGGAAQASGDTTTGAFKNMLAALNRVGAGLLGSVFPYFKDFFGSVTTLFDALGPTSTRLGDIIGKALQPGVEKLTGITDKIKELASAEGGLTFQGLRDAFPLVDKVAGVFERLAPVGSLVVDTLGDMGPKLAPLLPILTEAARELLPKLVDHVANLAPKLVELVPKVVDFAVLALPLLSDALTKLIIPAFEAVLPFLTAALDSFKLFTDTLSGGISPQGFVDGMNTIYDSLGPIGQYGQAVILTIQLTMLWFKTLGDRAGEVFRFLADKFGWLPQISIDVVTAMINHFTQLPRAVGTLVGTMIGFFLRIPPQMVGAVAGGVAQTIGVLLGLPPRASAAIGDLSNLLYSRGVSLIQGFARGILNSVSTVTSAVQRVLSVVPDFFPNSPAKRGPLSGAGWRKVTRAGGAIADEFARGFPTTSALDPFVSRVVSIGSAGSVRPSVVSRNAGAGGLTINGDVHTQDLKQFEAVLARKARMAAMASGMGGLRFG